MPPGIEAECSRELRPEGLSRPSAVGRAEVRVSAAVSLDHDAVGRPSSLCERKPITQAVRNRAERLRPGHAGKREHNVMKLLDGLRVRDRAVEGVELTDGRVHEHALDAQRIGTCGDAARKYDDDQRCRKQTTRSADPATQRCGSPLARGR